MATIVDSVLVDDDGSDQSTELDQRVPVTAVARQSRDASHSRCPAVSGLPPERSVLPAAGGMSLSSFEPARARRRFENAGPGYRNGTTRLSALTR
jgi:hypothetical protein